MNGYERTRRFVLGQSVDRPPFMPLVIEWVCRKEGLTYPDFVYKPDVRAKAYLDAVERYDLDCVLPDADFSEQLEDFGQIPTWTEAGFQVEPILHDLSDIDRLKLPDFRPGSRQGNRLEILRQVAAKEKGNRYIFGICIGPFTEYCNARGLKTAMHDMKKNTDQLMRGVEIFFQNGMNFIRVQLDAGADGIQIVEPNCSLISPKFYAQYIQPLHRQMVELIQRDGGFCRLHVCGDTTLLMPHTLATGTHILDVDAAVDLTRVAHLLGPQQCFCGNLNTAEELLFGKPEDFPAAVRKRVQDTGNRIILSGGCDVPPDTSVENMVAFHDAVAALAGADVPPATV